MNRRSLVCSIGEDKELAELGIVANLVYDRILTLTDEAGLAPGAAVVIKGRSFPYMADITVEMIQQAIDSLAQHGFVYKLVYHDRPVIAFDPEAFQKIQNFRKDYRRKFDYAELSQVVWQQGLPGIRAWSEREQGNSTVTVTVTVTPPNPPAGELFVADAVAEKRQAESPEGDDDELPGFERFWEEYPSPKGLQRKTKKAACRRHWKRAKLEREADAVLEGLRRWKVSDAWRRDGGKYIHATTTWLNNELWKEIQPAEKRIARVDPVAEYVGTLDSGYILSALERFIADRPKMLDSVRNNLRQNPLRDESFRQFLYQQRKAVGAA